MERQHSEYANNTQGNSPVSMLYIDYVIILVAEICYSISNLPGGRLSLQELQSYIMNKEAHLWLL